MPVFDNIPEKFYQCRDGSYSTSNRPGSCAWRGGLEGSVFSWDGGGSSLGVVDVPLGKINTAPEWFQNRQDLFSKRTVANIVEAIQTGNFRWANFDPVTLWKNPQNSKLYILSGHSRKEAFRIAADMGLEAEGKGFSQIPSKILEDITLEEAQKIALESNTLSTPETPIERAAYYRAQREKGLPEKDIRETAKRLEGRNASKILAFSYLNPNGQAFTALAALANSSDATSRGNIEAVASWIGEARRKYPMLTNGHENELYNWLVHDKAFGTSRGQISNQRDFLNRVYSVINKRSLFGEFDADQPLNLRNLTSKSPTEAVYDQQLENAKQRVKAAEKALKDKIQDLTGRGASSAQVKDLTQEQEAELRNARIDLSRLLQNKGEVMKAARSELSLFDAGPAPISQEITLEEIDRRGDEMGAGTKHSFSRFNHSCNEKHKKA